MPLQRKERCEGDDEAFTAIVVCKERGNDVDDATSMSSVGIKIYLGRAMAIVSLIYDIHSLQQCIALMAFVV